MGTCSYIHGSLLDWYLPFWSKLLEDRIQTRQKLYTGGVIQVNQGRVPFLTMSDTRDLLEGIRVPTIMSGKKYEPQNGTSLGGNA